MKGEIIGYTALGQSGKQEITIALNEDVDTVIIGKKVYLVKEE